jgi:hypothetical protein
VTYTTDGDLAELAPGLQLTVYRVVQEALTNILKHAEDATHVTVPSAAGRIRRSSPSATTPRAAPRGTSRARGTACSACASGPAWPAAP